MALESATEKFDWKNVKSFYEFNEIDVDGAVKKFERYKGHRVLVVFAASTKMLMKGKECNSTIPKDYTGSFNHPKVVLFPCNDFRTRKPGLSVEELKSIQYTCHFGIDIFPKVETEGENAYFLWKWLTESAPITVNQEFRDLDRVEFCIDKNGAVLRRVNVPKEHA